MSIIKLLNKKFNRIIFATPSHSQKPIFSKEFNSFFKKDVSEYVGFDNLSNPKSSIFLAQGKASNIIGSKQTFFITQGATTAILTALKTLIEPNDKVLVARNCHKSVYNGLILSGANVDWFLPEFDDRWGIYTHIDFKKLDSVLDINNYKAFIITSPTYEGINSDIEKISKICKSHGVYLIVDESHGTLNNFSGMLPKSAIKARADVSINSLHKTAGALNQCAILNISKEIFNADVDDFQKNLNLFHTSSPSYPLLMNIEECLSFLNSKQGQIEINNLFKNISTLKEKLSKIGYEFFECENHDPTKILLKKEGMSGNKLTEILFDKYNIEDEISSEIACLFITGIGTRKNKFLKLQDALTKIVVDEIESFSKQTPQPLPIVKIQPSVAINKKSTLINSQNALGKISAETIMPYPPGIGLLYPGEQIQEWHLSYLKENIEVIQ